MILHYLGSERFGCTFYHRARHADVLVVSAASGRDSMLFPAAAILCYATCCDECLTWSAYHSLMQLRDCRCTMRGPGARLVRDINYRTSRGRLTLALLRFGRQEIELPLRMRSVRLKADIQTAKELQVHWDPRVVATNSIPASAMFNSAISRLPFRRIFRNNCARVTSTQS